MAAIFSSLLAGSALLHVANAQNFDGGGRDGESFSYIQPLNTTILGEYGHSPAVYPSRKLYLLCYWAEPLGFVYLSSVSYMIDHRGEG